MINLPPYHNDPADNWAGMTLQEIQMRRALVQARMEIEKYRLQTKIENLQNNNPLASAGGWMSRVAGAFTWIEYAFMAVKIFNWFRKRR